MVSKASKVRISNAGVLGRQGRGFDRLAPFYDAMLRVTSGNAVHKSQVACLAHVPAGGRVLLLGGGTGRLAKKIVEVLHPKELVCVDISARMAEITQRRLAHCTGNTSVKFVVEDIRQYRPNGKFSLIFTPYLLDVFETNGATTVVSNLAPFLEEQGIWAVADFTHPDHLQRVHRLVQRSVLRLLYTFFRLTCGIEARALPDIQAIMVHNGFRRTWSESRFFGMLTSAIYTSREKH